MGVFSSMFERNPLDCHAQVIFLPYASLSVNSFCTEFVSSAIFFQCTFGILKTQCIVINIIAFLIMDFYHRESA